MQDNSIFDKVKTVQDDDKYAALNYYLQKKAREQCIPLTAYFELTPVCNFHCKMCYSRLEMDQVNEQGGLLSGKEWIKIAKKVKELGTAYFVFTGGECILHPDFFEIYRTVYNENVSISIFTNASTINEKVMDLFKELPPQNISITLYGFSDLVYEKTCGNGAAFGQVISNILSLKRAGFPMLLKSTITRDMLCDFPKIVEFARENGIRFIHSSHLMKNREAEQRENSELEVDIDEVNDMMCSIAKMNGDTFEVPEKIDIENGKKTNQVGMMCGSGKSVLSVNWHGEIMPCLTCDFPKFYALQNENSVRDAWNSIKEWSKTVPQIIECQLCAYQHKCRKCVFVHYADTHEFGKPSPRLCYKVQHGITD